MRTIALAHDSATYLQISVIFAFNTHSIAGETDREELMEKGWWFNLPKILFSKIVHLLNIAESLLSVRDISPVYTSPYTLWCFCWKKTSLSIYHQSLNFTPPNDERKYILLSGLPLTTFVFILVAQELAPHPWRMGGLGLHCLQDLNQSINQKSSRMGLQLMSETIFSWMFALCQALE